MTFHMLIPSALVALTLVGIGSWACPGQSSLLIVESQEVKDRDRERSDKPADRPAIDGAIQRLKQAVNGHSSVANRCTIQGHDFEVEESSELVETSSCDITVTTIKKSKSGAGDLLFTLKANLADLTTPASVERLNLAGCKPERGEVFQVVSRTQPGKGVRAVRSSPATPSTNSSVSEPVTSTRKNLIFFFSDEQLAKKGAHALDRAVSVCGGEEWPDEDDLP